MREQTNCSMHLIRWQYQLSTGKEMLNARQSGPSGRCRCAPALGTRAAQHPPPTVESDTSTAVPANCRTYDPQRQAHPRRLPRSTVLSAGSPGRSQRPDISTSVHQGPPRPLTTPAPARRNEQVRIALRCAGECIQARTAASGERCPTVSVSAVARGW